MDEGVPDSAAPAPIFLGDMNSLEEIHEPKQDKINILGFMGGFVTPPALFVLLWGVWYIGDFDWIGVGFWYWLFGLCSFTCIWPTAGVIITIMAYKKGNTEEAIGAIFAFIIWILIILPWVFI